MQNMMKKLAKTQLHVKFCGFERFILLKVVDTLWMDHIDQMTIKK